MPPPAGSVSVPQSGSFPHWKWVPAHCQAIAVNGCHVQGVALHLEQLTRQHRFCLADRSGVAGLPDHGVQHRLFDLHTCRQIQTGQRRIFLRGHGGDLELCGIAEQLYHIVVVHLHGDHVAGKAAYRLAQQPGQNDKFAGAVGFNLDTPLNAEFQVIARQFQIVVIQAELQPLQRRDRGFLRDALCHVCNGGVKRLSVTSKF
mgnify:CR=1 FL=1